VSAPIDDSDNAVETAADAKVEAKAEDGVYVLDHELIDAVEDALDAGDGDRARDLTAELHDADIADLLQHLDGDRRRAFVQTIRQNFHPDILAELDDVVRDDVIEQLGVADTALAVAGLESDDAVQVIAELDDDDQQQVLDAMPEAERSLIEQALTYPEESAGRLMQREVVAVPTFWTVGEIIDFFRRSADDETSNLPTEFHDIYVVDPVHKPVGAVTLSHLLRTRRPVSVRDIMQEEIKVVPANTDQEDVAFLFRQRDLTSAPVVDDAGRLVGVITIDDVVDVMDEEHEEDIMRLGGVKEDDLYSDVVGTARSRFTWLFVNLGTAILASLVIGLFEATIDQMVALAVLMPIVASMGGNAGTQTLTVAVRALATKELTASNALRVVGKELLVGGVNGVILALITAVVAWVWFGNVAIAVVIAAAMVFNLVVAALAGASIPMVLERLKIDPAIASGVFLTTITDVVGFFAFLGLAAWILI